jgi:hypothetical protein
MKHWLLLLPAVCIAAIACGGDNSNPAAPTSTTGTGPFVFTAEMSTDNEIPHPSNAESTAHGAVQITMRVTRDSANAITGATADFTIQMTGLPTDTTFVGAHIHPGVAGVTGPVIVNTTLSSGTPQTVVGGAMTWTFNNITVPAATAQQLLDNPAAFYFNVHTFMNPAGVARGQVRRTF